jgi:hypothetical protein
MPTDIVQTLSNPGEDNQLIITAAFEKDENTTLGDLLGLAIDSNLADVRVGDVINSQSQTNVASQKEEDTDNSNSFIDNVGSFTGEFANSEYDITTLWNDPNSFYNTANKDLITVDSNTNGSNLSSEDNLNNSPVDKFYVEWNNADSVSHRFYFSLLPSMQSNLSSAGQTPEVKPGILQRTSVDIKPFTVPGAPPIYQVLGVQSTLLQVVGLFIGSEQLIKAATSGVGKDLNPVIGTAALGADLQAYSNSMPLDAYSKALFFEREIVQLAKQIRFVVYSSPGTIDNAITIKYNCLIQSFRYFITRSDRVYYALELLVLDSKHHTNADVSALIEEESILPGRTVNQASLQPVEIVGLPEVKLPAYSEAGNRNWLDKYGLSIYGLRAGFISDLTVSPFPWDN